MMNVDKLVETIKANTTLEVTVHDVQKGNVILTGISIGNGTVRPTLYTRNYEDLYSKYGYEKVAKQMLEDAKNADKINPIDCTYYMSWEYAKENLKLCIAPKETNKGAVTYPYLDLELYVRVMIKEMSNEDKRTSYKVQETMLNTWNITREQLLHAALDCTKPTYKVQSLSELLFGIEDTESPMLVVRTEDEMNGASVMYCKDILKEIADKYNNDLFIIPSSIHEILVNPIDQLELSELTTLVKEVNTEQLSPEEVLSDHAYIFHREANKIIW